MIKEIKNKLRYYRNYTEVKNTRDGMGLEINSILGNTQQDSTTGKNLYKGESITTSGSGTRDDVEIFLASGKTYTVSLNKSVDTEADMYLKTADHEDITKYAFKSSGKNTLTFTTTQDVYNIGWYMAGAMNITDIQIEEGNTTTEYEKFSGGIPSPNPLYPQPINSAVVSEISVSDNNGNINSITLSSPIELNKIGGVADEVAEGKVTRNFSTVIIDGTETVARNATWNYYVIEKAIPNTSSNAMSNYGKVVSESLANESNAGKVSFTATHIYVGCYGMNITTVDDFKALLAENPMEILYELSEPVVTDLPTEDVLALDSLKTFDGITYISTDSDIQPVMEIEYGVMKYREWQSGDYFNAEDYNRISANIRYLKAYLDGLFANMENISAKEEKTYLSLIYAREINAIENELDSINRESYGLEIGTKQIYRANGKTPIYSEFDRIESALARIMEKALLHKNNLPRLAFRLGSQKGLKV